MKNTKTTRAARPSASEIPAKKLTTGRLDATSVVILLSGVIAALLCLFTSSALAFRTHVPLTQTEVPGGEGGATSIGVNNTTGHFYVVNSPVGKIYNFGPDGKLDPAQPQLTGAPGSQPFAIAVDNSAGSSGGTIWAASGSRANVLQYNATGVATGLEIKETSVPPDGTVQAAGLPPVVNNGSFTPRALAVDSAGDLYIVDFQNGAIDKFSPAGTFIAQLAAGELFDPVSGYIDITGIAVDDNGDIWYSAIGAATNGLFELNPSGQCVPVSCGPIDSVPMGGVAVDRSSGTILGTANPENVTKPYIAEYDEEGHPLGTSKPIVEEGISLSAIALDESVGRESSGRVYTGVGAEYELYTFGPVILLPDATTEVATNVSADSAVFHGQVGADAGPAASCVFQYVDEASFQTERFAQAQSVPCSPTGPFTGETSNTVAAVAVGLNGGTTYHYRLLATSATGSNPGEDLPFTTSGPSAGSQSISAVTETGARLEATVNPNGVETSYFFEFVSEAQFQQSGFAKAVHVPIAPLPVGSGSADVPVTQAVAGLAPGTSYRYRVIATDDNGAIGRGSASSFATFAYADPNLPDARVYEQASPVQKNGGDVLGEPNAVRAAASGGAVTFYSLVGIPGGAGAQTYGVYQADRASDGTGWATEGLLPEAAAGPYARILGWSEELTDSYSTVKRTGEPPVLDARRRGGALETLSLGTGEANPQHSVAGATASGEVVYFEKAPRGKQKPAAYVWDRQTEAVSLVGVLNNGKAPAEGTLAGPYDWFQPVPDTTLGGAKAGYYTQAANALSADGKRAFFTEAGTGQLYVRENPLKPQSSLDGNGRCTEPELACTIRVSAPAAGIPDPLQPAAFLGATATGTEVYFLSAGRLTSDATAGEGSPDLYRFNLESGELTDLTVDVTPSDPNGAEVQGLVGTVGDGSHIYFVANGVLASGAAHGNCSPGGNAGQCNLYVVSGSGTEFIARLSSVTGHEAIAGEIGDERDWAPVPRVASGFDLLKENASRTTYNGRTLLFSSSQRLTGFANNNEPELYLKRVGSPLSCISCSPSGAPPTGAASLQTFTGGYIKPELQFGTLTRNLSTDGTRVFFDTPDPLVATDTNGTNDVYEWEEAGVGSCQTTGQNGGCLYLLSTGKSASPSYFGDASANGDDAFFFTEQSLVRQDRDQLYDVYDARVDGGIPAQNQAEPAICSGEECPGAAVGAPPSPTVGSAGAQAPDPRPKQCKKGFKRVRKHGKDHCVKHQKKHKKKPRKHKKAKKHEHHQRGNKTAGNGKAGNR